VKEYLLLILPFPYHFVSMPDYIRNEVVDIIMILRECRGNYRAAARLYCVRFFDRRPADIVIARIERRERR